MQKKLEEAIPRKKNKDGENENNSRVPSPRGRAAPTITDFQQFISKGKTSMGLPAVGSKIDSQ